MSDGRSTKGPSGAPSHSEEDRMLPFFDFKTPPQDMDALMHFDAEVFRTHPGLKAFMRPLVAADGPEGKLKLGEHELGAEEMRQFQEQFWKEIEDQNCIKVTQIAPGVRMRQFIKGLRVCWYKDS